MKSKLNSKKNNSKNNNSKRNSSKNLIRKSGKRSNKKVINESKKRGLKSVSFTCTPTEMTELGYKNRKDYFADLLEVEKDQLKAYHYKYLTLQFPQWCCKTRINPSFDNIYPYRWNYLNQELIKLYQDSPGLTFYQEQAELIFNLPQNKPIDLKLNEWHLNQLILDFIKTRDRSKIITLFPNTNLEIQERIKLYLSKETLVYASKDIPLTPKAAANLLYQLDALESGYSKYSEIVKKVKELGWSDQKETIKVYLFDVKSNHDLLKIRKEINNIYQNNQGLKLDWLGGGKNREKKSSNKEKISKREGFNPNNYYQITNYFLQTIEAGQIYFNQNSLNFLELQDLKRHMGIGFRKCRLFVNALKKWLLTNLNLIDKDRFIVLSGGMLYTFGLRTCGDLDMFISPYPTSYANRDFEKKIYKYFLHFDKAFPFVDTYYPKIKWLDFWEDWHSEWSSSFGASNMIEVIHNPKFHYYFMGLKFIILDAEISRRNIRGRPAAVADLIMINKLLGVDIKIATIPKEIIKDGKQKEYGEKYFSAYVKGILKNKYNYYLSRDEIEKYLTFEK